MTLAEITECPRDAMQGIKSFIPTALKRDYLNALLEVGFHTLDFGSFVSAAAIPQMADTKDLVPDLMETNTRLLAIIANLRGAEDALKFKSIKVLGFPFSISETFQIRNTRSGMEESFMRLQEIYKMTQSEQRTLRVYISMAFGNPYGDPWSNQMVADWICKIKELGVTEIALADTTGHANPEQIINLYSHIKKMHSELNISLHLHANPEDVSAKLIAGIQAGCLQWDSALLGFGGCPMASHSLTGNLDTLNLVNCLKQHQISVDINIKALERATEMAQHLFARFN